ncbi:hypothetical protein OSB04_020070 [Centaurea solstitialis]|uniref:Uncharacterized protein n=1 Tax=Centaurea solstitialis TaxID=347529 RepID=A0AA38T9Z0_9ASTR|nr:hypothetical protein OSB04_020070 [Centaurea solstitialis]
MEKHIFVDCAYCKFLSAVDALGLRSEVNNGLIAADTDQSSLILCGKAFCDSSGIKKALAALAEPIIISREGLLLHARILVSCNSVFLIFISEDTIRGWSEKDNEGVIWSPHGVSPLFRTTNPGSLFPSRFPATIVLASSDSLGLIPTISKLTPGQVAYHFLAGYQNGTFNPAYGITSYLCDTLQIAKTLYSKLVDNQTCSFLINVNQGEKQIAGMDFVKLVESSLDKNIPPFEGNCHNQPTLVDSTAYEYMPLLTRSTAGHPFSGDFSGHPVIFSGDIPATHFLRRPQPPSPATSTSFSGLAKFSEFSTFNNHHHHHYNTTTTAAAITTAVTPPPPPPPRPPPPS